MQIHPDDSENAVKHAIDSLAAGYIGLDFGTNIGDLTKIKQEKLPENQRDYLAFAKEMKIGDTILIIAHHFPFAMVTVSGKYNFIRKKSGKLGFWFKHFRKVKDIKYYSDYVKNPKSWKKIIMTDAISPLRDANRLSFKLIDQWKKDSAQ